MTWEGEDLFGHFSSLVLPLFTFYLP